MSASIDRLGLKDEVEAEQILFDKILSGFKHKSLVEEHGKRCYHGHTK